MKCRHVFQGNRDGVVCLKCGMKMTREQYLKKGVKNGELRKNDSVSDGALSEPKNTSL